MAFESFRSVHAQGCVRVAACMVPIHLADPDRNATEILEMARRCHDDGVVLALFSELSLSGYSIEDLLLQDVLLDGVQTALLKLLAESAALDTILVVGAPLLFDGRIYNTAVVMHRGQFLGVVPKSYLPNYREFYEKRQIATGESAKGTIRIGRKQARFDTQFKTGFEAQPEAQPAAKPVAPFEVPFGSDLLFAASDLPGFVFHVEICEDFWVPVPPSARAALAGATVLTNLSGSPITIGRAESRRMLAESASARCLAAYMYAAAGAGESTTDVAWDGQLMIFENGVKLAEGERFQETAHCIVADIDLDLLRQERLRMGTFDDNRRALRIDENAFRWVRFSLSLPLADIGLKRRLERFPFVPNDVARLHQDCYEAYSIQVAALVQRLRATGIKRVIIGISGGLDSTQALIVAAHAFDQLHMPRTDILTYTMPGFATGEVSKSYAWRLMTSLGTTAEELDIRPAAMQILKDIGHPFALGTALYDVTFENVQAGLRTDYLFRLANQHGGIVIGTGDLSELALGWCTYGVGDQMSHYGVNAGVPKTLMQHLIRWVMQSGQFADDVNSALADVLDSEISPELVPADKDGKVQSTESLVGPYALHDFFLFYIGRYGLRPSKVAFLAWHAWSDGLVGEWPANFPEDRREAYSLPQIRHWLAIFLKRFFAFSQFKRSAMPNGPKISPGGALSPRGDWRAPSDGNARIWLEELAQNVPDEPAQNA